MHIACAADSAYAAHAAAMIHSVLSRNAPGQICLHFLHDEALPRDALACLDEMVRALGSRIIFHSIADARVRRLPEMGRITRVMWYRILLPELLPEAERALYLDCDTLVMDDLRPLWQIDFGDTWLAAVRNVFERGQDARAGALGLGPGDYFNSGVLLMNLVAWREHGITARVIEAATGTRLTFPDQDALNLVLAGHWLPLHPRWNCQNSLFYFPQAKAVFGASQVAEAVRRPGILHFEGGELAKPWHYLSKHPHRQRYYQHLACTPWPVPPPEGRSFAHFFLRPLPVRWLVPTIRWLRRAKAAARRSIVRIGLAQRSG